MLHAWVVIQDNTDFKGGLARILQPSKGEKESKMTEPNGTFIVKYLKITQKNEEKK